MVDAEIRWTPNTWSEGEVTRVRPRDGRYAVWMPPGNWQVQVTAPGFQTVTRNVTVTAYDNAQILDIEMIPNWSPEIRARVSWRPRQRLMRRAIFRRASK